MIAVTYRVLRYTNRHDFDSYQVLQREMRIFGICVWRTEVDREEVPSWAIIQRACLGSTDWESRIFKQHANLLKP